jgi:type IV pilus assembly protein PilV
MKPVDRHAQSGVFLLEALIGILIFSIGILTMVALQAKSIEIQTDTQYRIEAANLADRMLGEIIIGVDRSSAGALQASLANFAHQATGLPASCNFSGAASGDARVLAWVNDVTTTAATRLPGASANRLQIRVGTDPAGNACNFNCMTITVCWQTAADAVPRRHTLITYIN